MAVSTCSEFATLASHCFKGIALTLESPVAKNSLSGLERLSVFITTAHARESLLISSHTYQQVVPDALSNCYGILWVIVQE